MLVSLDTKAITMMVEPGNHRVWIECTAFVEYLRMVERRGIDAAAGALKSEDAMTYAGLTAIHDTIRQIADSLIVTAMEAQETVARGGRDES